MQLAILAGLVTLTLQNVPVSEVGEMYEDLSGQRVMVHPEVQDTVVTVRAFKPLPSPRALEWIEESLKLEGVAFERGKDVIVWRSCPKPESQAARVEAERVVLRFLPVSEFLEAINQAASGIGTGFSPISQARPLVVEAAPVGMIVPPSNQQPLAGGSLGGSGGIADVLGVRVVPDPGGNAVTLYGPKAGRDTLRAMALQMDQSPAMIELEVVIAECAVSDGQSVGVDWSQVFNQATDSLKLAGTVRGASLVDLARVRSGAQALYGGEGLTVFGQVSNDYSAVLQALSKLEDFRILQKPKLQTANHKPATIYVGERVPIPGRTITETATVSTTEYLPIRLEVAVTPHLMEGGKIRLDFRQTKNDVTGFSEVAGNTLPNISEQGVESIVVGADGQTVFLGGLRTKRNAQTVTGVPGLNRLPVLKYVFGSVKTTVETKEILVFVTPKIGQPNLAAEFAKDISGLFR